MRLYSILKEGGVMKNFLIIIVFNLIFLPVLCSGQTFGLKPISNNISLYQNSYDDWKDAGRTLQIVMINSFKLGTWFTLEITGDIDRSLQEKGKTCHYFEFGLVKDIVPRFGLNYQRIIGTFVDKPVNQFGIRLSF
jgi:hypothetical protein